MAEAEGTQPNPARSIAIDTPVARPVPERQVVTRRLFLLGGFWSTIGLAVVGLAGAPLDFMWIRNPGGFGGPVPVTPDRVPAEGADPIRIIEGRFWLVNIAAGPTSSGVDSPGGLLAMYQKCPHLGCTVPYRGDFVFNGVKGWFRCPCHGSTYTKDGGVRVYGPAPRPLDVFPLVVNDDLSITVDVGRQYVGNGSPDNPLRTAPYQAGGVTQGVEKI